MNNFPTLFVISKKVITFAAETTANFCGTGRALKTPRSFTFKKMLTVQCVGALAQGGWAYLLRVTEQAFQSFNPPPTLASGGQCSEL
jgi:hypothetical protein